VHIDILERKLYSSLFAIAFTEIHYFVILKSERIPYNFPNRFFSK